MKPCAFFKATAQIAAFAVVLIRSTTVAMAAKHVGVYIWTTLLIAKTSFVSAECCTVVMATGHRTCSENPTRLSDALEARYKLETGDFCCFLLENNL